MNVTPPNPELHEIVLWSADGRLTADLPHAGAHADGAPNASMEALVYPANARWAPQLVAGLPADVCLAHIRRASTIPIYLQLRPIRILFLDLMLVNDVLLERIHDVRRAQARRFSLIGIDSIRGSGRALELLRSTRFSRIVQLPLCSRVLAGVAAEIREAVGLAATPRPSILLVSEDLLLRERLRDAIEDHRRVFATTDIGRIRKFILETSPSSILVDISLPNQLLMSIALASSGLGRPCRILGIRGDHGVYRASELLAQRWVHRLLDNTFDPDTVNKLVA